MYKLFLTFRYLTRKKIVIFPILVVWLCVMMLIIVSGIMQGFVDRVRETNHDLFGDVIISGHSFTLGFSRYDDLRHQLEAKFSEEIEATTPSVQAYGLAYFPIYKDSRPAILVGINPEERAKVTRFRESLFNQYSAPTQAVEDLAPHLPATREELIEYARRRGQDLSTRQKELLDLRRVALDKVIDDVRPSPNWNWSLGVVPLALLILLLLTRARRSRSGTALIGAIILGMVGLIVLSLGVSWPVLFPREYKLLEDRVRTCDLDLRQAQRTFEFANAMPPGRYRTREELAKAIVPPEAFFKVPPEIVATSAGIPGEAGGGLPPNGCIVGSQLGGIFERDMRGNFVHPIGPLYMKTIITVFPASSKGSISINASNAVQQDFTVVDDSHTGVFDIDQTYIYAPLELVQRLSGLGPDPELVKQDPTANFEPRCQEILIKLKNSSKTADIRAVRARIADFVEKYQANNLEVSPLALTVQTWDEKQARYLGAVENEKVIIIFILGMMSLVVLVVIFLIFYQIVRDKTRDIGIIKAVGGSEEGVAGIFLSYGLLIGIVGGGLGVLGGVLFVTHTNQIHEWIFNTTGIVIWDRSVYLFDRIPDTVQASDVIMYFVVALVAGVLGALIPAVIAGTQDPVQAVRYE